jgi:sensor histidine kinase regulating citrate/malate metabolism
LAGDLRKTTIWPGFWSIVGAVSIRTKVMGIATVCILIAALALVWSDYRSTFNMLSNQLQKRGISIAAGLATQGRDSVLTIDQFTLYRLVRNTLHSDEDLTYILVLDTEHNVLVHTFDQSVPLELLGINQLYSEDQYRVQALRTEDGIIYDVAVPILGGQAGAVRVGMSEASIRDEVNQQFIGGLLWVAIVLVIGLYIAYGMAAFLTKPISLDGTRPPGRRMRLAVWVISLKK